MKDESAFPHIESDFDGSHVYGGGLTKLEYFAGQAMQGLLASDGLSEFLQTHETDVPLELGVAKGSIAMAKELINQLEAENK